MNLEILIKSGNNPANRKLDLTPDLSFPISYLISTVEDISATKGGISKTIVLPDTPNNRELLGYLTDLSVDLGYNYFSGFSNSYNPNLKVPCVVLEDSIPISTNACIQITGFDIINGNNVINATIYDGNTSLINDIGEMFLTDLDFSELNFVYSINAVTQSWNNSNDSYKLGYYCLLGDYGNGRLNSVLNNNGVNFLKLADFFPGPYVKIIWDKIFSTKGYTVDSTLTAKIGGTPDTRFASLVIPYNKQLLQTDPVFIQDKIFHVGLSTSNINSVGSLVGGQSYTFGSTISTYQGKTYSGAATYPKSIVNMTNVADDRSLWYSGLCLNPWQNSSSLNNASLDPSTLNPQGFTISHYTFTNTIVPFNLIDSPMFKGTYNTSNYYYQGNTNSGVYKQTFTLNADIVTNYSAKYKDPGVTDKFSYFKGICNVVFYREYIPSSIGPGTYSIDPGFAGGTGSIIPAYMGDDVLNANVYTTCVDEDGVTDKLTHWVVDRNQRSNCFTKAGKLIVPNDYTGADGNVYTRYLGEYYVNDTGVFVAEPSDDGTVFYPKNSGDCIAWYNNFDNRFSRPDLVGLWVSGHESPPLVNGSSGTERQFDYRSAHGDWYQQLSLNTITLDGDVTNQFYGAAGSRMVNGNKPIQPGERVRCVVNFGSYWPGSRFTTTQGAYMPPSVGYLLTSTYFKNELAYPYGTYQTPATSPYPGFTPGSVTNNPLTQFFNTVSTEYIDQSIINFNDLIPKNIKVKDFLKDVIQKHCLYIEPSRINPKHLTIETRDVFFNGEVLDWTRKLDVSRPINIQLLADTQTKKTTFTYKADGDWYNKQYTQFTNEIYGQQVFISPNQFAQSEKKIESIFSPTPLVPIYTTLGASNVAQPGTFVVPTFVNGANVGKGLATDIPNGYIQTNYRMLQRKYIQNTNGDTLAIFGNQTDYYPYAGPYADPYANNPYTINWGSTKGEFINRNTSDITNNLINNYWATYLTELQDMDSRLITCYMFLTAQDINSFSFRNQVRVNINNVDLICKVDSIQDYIPGANVPCKVVLLKSKAFTTPLVFTDSLGSTI